MLIFKIHRKSPGPAVTFALYLSVSAVPECCTGDSVVAADLFMMLNLLGIERLYAFCAG
jgi:hypothetical protein